MPVPTLVLDHPLAADRLGTLRDRSSDRTAFRAALFDLAGMLVYEACRTLPTTDVTVHTPLATASGRRPTELPLLVPVLRAGLGMLDAALRLLPGAEVAFVGVRRNEATLLPDAYVSTLPGRLGGRRALVLDPMLATGGSVLHTLRLLADAGADASAVTVCCALAAPEGLAALGEGGFGDVLVVTAAVDCRLNDLGFIVPGLGDAGDRQFGSP